MKHARALSRVRHPERKPPAAAIRTLLLPDTLFKAVWDNVRQTPWQAGAIVTVCPSDLRPCPKVLNSPLVSPLL